MLPALALSLAVAVACVDRSAGPLAPPDATATPTASLVLEGTALEPTAAALAGAAVADALARLIPTLAPGEARDALAGALGELDASLGAGDAVLGAAAAIQAREALAAIVAAGADSPAELSAVELAVDRADALLAASVLDTP